MDPITQAALGAAAAQTAFGHKLGGKTWLLGAVGGVLADADVLIFSPTDPLVEMIYHRHFTHSLAFVPVGGALAALPFLLFSKSLRAKWPWTLAAAMLAYLTHAPLDTCTSYGTLLGWPFSDHRFALDWLAILDLFVTVPLLIGVAWSAVKGSRKPAAAGLAAALLYMGLGALQHSRAMNAQEALLASRGHTPGQQRVTPTLFNVVLWRSVYVHEDRIHSDAIRVPVFGRASYQEGEAVPLFDASDFYLWLETDSPPALKKRFRRAFRVFHWFADGYLAMTDHSPLLIGDGRYSLNHSRFDPLWGLEFNPSEIEMPVKWKRLTPEGARAEAMKNYFDGVFGDLPHPIPPG